MILAGVPLPHLHAAPGDGYAGAKACAPCHPAQSSTQIRSGHARSLHPAASHPLASLFTQGDWLVREPGYKMRFQRAGKEIRAQAYDDKNTLDIPVEWAFGAGEQAVTFVTRIDPDWYLEHFYSYYSASGGMAPTAGHSKLRPGSLPEAMGLPYKAMDPATGILGCFECHSTGPVRSGAQQELQPSEAGVRCEACHGPGAEHVRAKSRQTIQNPGKLPSAESLVLCGRCHRPPAAAGTQIDWEYPWNVRHQPIYLAQSKCLNASGGKLSCLTCHDPHRPLEKNKTSYYRERCLSCHNGKSAPVAPAASCGKDAASDCAACHMPRVSPQPSLQFTNHWIGVYREGSPLRPVIHQK